MQKTTSLTIAVESLPGRAAVRADARCASCGSTLRVPEGVYVLRLTLDHDLALVRGTLRQLSGAREWSFASGRELAQLVAGLGHDHDGS